ncbi:MAG: hypothetical protein JSW58_14190 [Candidatus Latescibacterota bacterium]|nr:MAG: hypothetical protein JSW58_14190 [Candidatus Latescibacterota bacterium]
MLPNAGRAVLYAIYVFLAILMFCGVLLDFQYYRQWEGRGLFSAVLFTLVLLIATGDTTGIDIKIQEFVNRMERREIRKRSKREPIYGDPNDTRYLKGDDRPLPPELRYRVCVYLGKRKKTDSDAFEKAVARASSVNALLRRELMEGKL